MASAGADATKPKVCWQDKLHNFAWRIDAKTKAAESTGTDPTAIVELAVGPEKTETTKPTVIRFEMDRKQIAAALVQINNIQQKIAGN